MRTLPTITAMLRRYGATALVIIAGALLGAAAAPREAEAATHRLLMDGWTCFETDRCHGGSQACCNDPDTDPDLTHCTTMCNGCNPAC